MKKQKEKEIHIFVDTSEKMHIKLDNEKTTAMDRIYKFILYLAKQGDRQPAYMHRIHIHIGDEYLPFKVGNASRKIRESKGLIYKNGSDSDFHENLWVTVLEGDGHDNNLFFVFTRGVEGETLDKFHKYQSKVLFMDFSQLEISLTLEQQQQVHVIRKEDVKKAAKNFHREFLSPYITKVNFGISMKTELMRNGALDLENDENFKISEITVVGKTTSWKTVEVLPILMKNFILPIDECYDRKSSKIKSHEAYGILKELMEQETESEAKSLANSDELAEPTLLVGCATDRDTRIHRPVILRLHSISKNDKNYDDVITKNAADVDYRSQDVDYRIPESPASPDASTPPGGFQMPKIIPVDTVEETEGPQIALEELVLEDLEDVRIEVIVLKMTWDTFVDTVAFADDQEEIDELIKYENETEEPAPSSDYTKLVGWYTPEAVAYYISKLHRATRKLALRQADFDSHISMMTEMVQYSQNPSMALRLADAIRAHDLEHLDAEDTVIVETAAKRFEEMYKDMVVRKEPRQNLKNGDQKPKKEPLGPCYHQGPNYDRNPYQLRIHQNPGTPLKNPYDRGLPYPYVDPEETENWEVPEAVEPQKPQKEPTPSKENLTPPRLGPQYHYQNRQAFLEGGPMPLALESEPEPEPEPYYFQAPPPPRQGSYFFPAPPPRFQAPPPKHFPRQAPPPQRPHCDEDQNVQNAGRRLQDVHFEQHGPLIQYEDSIEEHPTEKPWVAPPPRRGASSRGARRPGRFQKRRGRGGH